VEKLGAVDPTLSRLLPPSPPSVDQAAASFTSRYDGQIMDGLSPPSGQRAPRGAPPISYNLNRNIPADPLALLRTWCSCSRMLPGRLRGDPMLDDPAVAHPECLGDGFAKAVGVGW